MTWGRDLGSEVMGRVAVEQIQKIAARLRPCNFGCCTPLIQPIKALFLSRHTRLHLSLLQSVEIVFGLCSAGACYVLQPSARLDSMLECVGLKGNTTKVLPSPCIRS